MLLPAQEGEPARYMSMSLGGGPSNMPVCFTPTGTELAGHSRLHDADCGSASDFDHGGNFEFNSGYFFNRHFGSTGKFSLQRRTVPLPLRFAGERLSPQAGA